MLRWRREPNELSPEASPVLPRLMTLDAESPNNAVARIQDEQNPGRAMNISNVRVPVLRDKMPQRPGKELKGNGVQEISFHRQCNYTNCGLDFGDLSV